MQGREGHLVKGGNISGERKINKCTSNEITLNDGTILTDAELKGGRYLIRKPDDSTNLAPRKKAEGKGKKVGQNRFLFFHYFEAVYTWGNHRTIKTEPIDLLVVNNSEYALG
jgi:hypothetical protein